MEKYENDDNRTKEECYPVWFLECNCGDCLRLKLKLGIGEKEKEMKNPKGRKKGFHHSEETKEKMRERKLQDSANRKEGIRTFTLEEVLSQAKGDIEKSCEVYNINLKGREIQICAISEEGVWFLNHSEIMRNLFPRIRQMLELSQTRYVIIRTAEGKERLQQEVTSILKVEGRYIIKGDYEVEVARREGRTSALDREMK